MSNFVNPINCNPFFSIVGYNVGGSGLIMSLQEFDDTEDLAYLYSTNGNFIKTRPGVPRDDPLGYFNHTQFAKIGADVFGVDGGQSLFDLYKNGIGWQLYTVGGSVTALTTSSAFGNYIWLSVTRGLHKIDPATGAKLQSIILLTDVDESVLRHRTNGDAHIVVYFNGVMTSPITNWRFQCVLLNSAFQQIQVLGEHYPPEDVEQMSIEYADVAINSDRCAHAIHDTDTGITTIRVFDLTGSWEKDITYAGYNTILLMSEDRLYANDAPTGLIYMWDITEDQSGNKIYTSAGSFTTQAPYAWAGNLVI